MVYELKDHIKTDFCLVVHADGFVIHPELWRDEFLDYEGNYVIMKSASHMKEVKELLAKTNRQVQAVENCSMETERVYRNLSEIPDDAGYFSLIIAKKGPNS